MEEDSSREVQEEGGLSAVNSEPAGGPEEGYICQVCGKGFKLKSSLIGHSLTHAKEVVHYCIMCEREFSSKYHLRVHLRVHAEGKRVQKPSLKKSGTPYSQKEKRFPCELCTRAFVFRADLHRHMLAHQGIKRFVCMICDKGFSRRRVLEAHQVTHTGERPHQCVFCDKAFTTKTNLIRHFQVHTGEKPFPCPTCHLGFSTKDVLEVHMNTHLGRNFKCKQCSSTFHTARTLENHVLKFHSDPSISKFHLDPSNGPFACTTCHKAFALHQNLSRHQKLAHKSAESSLS